MATIRDLLASAENKRQEIDVDALTAFLDSIQSFSQDLILATDSNDRALYHYTDLRALTGILENEDLWLTHSRYSNDDEELTHGYNVVQKVVKQALEGAADPKRNAYLSELADLISTPPPEGVYICCFCEQSNLLSQWRSYGANGSGVSIEFDPKGFAGSLGATRSDGLLRFWKVFYEPETQERIIRSAIDFTLVQNPTESPDVLAKRAADAIHFFVPTFKNRDFNEEVEWRLIFTPAPACRAPRRFRIARNMLVPYYSLNELFKCAGASLQRLPIKTICLGPSPNKHLNLESARMLLAQRGYADVTVDASDTPYRG